MNRTTKTIMQIAVAIVLMAVLSVIAYYGGSSMAKSFLSRYPDTKFPAWQALYFYLVVIVGVVSTVLLVAWHIMAHFVFSVSSPLGVSKRPTWIVLLVLTIIIALASPYAFAVFKTGLKLSIVIPLMFVALYGLVGFWGGSIFVTPDNYKYTPIGAIKIRGARKRK